MIEFRTILCPVDLSERSRPALAHALALARRYEGRVTLLNVLPELPFIVSFPLSPDRPALDPATRQGLWEELRAFAGPAADQAPLEAVVVEGDPARTIVERARDMGADLVVMGTHGRSGVERWVLGSVAEKVLRKAHCPVLTVPPSSRSAGEGDPRFRRILCPVDFSHPSLQGVKHALSLAEESKARLTLLHVVDWLPPRDARRGRRYDEYRAYVERDGRRRLQSLVPSEARNWCEPREEVVFGKPWREVLRRSAEEDADLVVMGVHGRGALDLMLFGSTTQHVVRAATCPVLTIRTP
jgi:nucleotide-binding universal stress UspA family protein